MDRDYIRAVSKVSRYMSVVGMYEVKSNGSYKVLNSSVNENLYEWKSYKADILFNEHNLLE